MKRRDLLRIIGIGGVLPFVKHDKAKAAPPVVTPVVEAPRPYTLGSATAFNEPFFLYTSGSVSLMKSCPNTIVNIDSDGYLVTSDNVRWDGEG